MASKNFVFALLALAIFAKADGLILAFSGRSLPSMDIGNGSPDAYINVYYAPSSSGQYQFIDESDDISDNRNPDWPETFNIPNNGGHTQMLKIDIYDADSPDSDDYMGTVEINLNSIINDPDGLLTLSIVGGEPGGGNLLIKRQ